MRSEFKKSKYQRYLIDFKQNFMETVYFSVALYVVPISMHIHCVHQLGNNETEINLEPRNPWHV